MKKHLFTAPPSSPPDSRRPGRRCRTNPPPRKRSDLTRRQRRKSDSWDAPHARRRRARSTGAGLAFPFRFEGTRCARRRGRGLETNYYNVFVDGKPHGVTAGTGDHRAGRRIPTVCTPYFVQKRTGGRAGTHDASLSVPTGPCSMRPRPRAGTSSSSATCTPAGTARSGNREGALHARDRELRPGVGLHRTLLTQTTRPSHTPGRESYATGATRRRSPTAPCASA